MKFQNYERSETYRGWATREPSTGQIKNIFKTRDEARAEKEKGDIVVEAIVTVIN